MSRTHRATMPAPRSMWSEESSREHPRESSGLDRRADDLDVESRRQPAPYLDRVLVGFRIRQADRQLAEVRREFRWGQDDQAARRYMPRVPERVRHTRAH